MTGFIVCVFPFRNRVSPKEAFEGLELGEGKSSRPVLRGPGGRKAAWLLGSNLSRTDSRHYFRLADTTGGVDRIGQHFRVYRDLRQTADARSRDVMGLVPNSYLNFSFHTHVL
jgi:hypothetical protein